MIGALRNHFLERVYQWGGGWVGRIQGAAAHPSADIYAWGRVVVFLLTGRTAIDAVADMPSRWRERLTACTSVVPEQRPDASTVQGSLGA